MRRSRGETVWPKQRPELTVEQAHVLDDFYQYWLETLPAKFGVFEWFNHRYPASRAVKGGRTLEIGAGLGVQLGHENLDEQEYYATDLRQQLVDQILRDFPKAHALVADAQERLPFDDAFFDRALAIHVLEHLPNLPAALNELWRVLKPSGRLVACIPCEAGFLHRLGRRLSARPMFERRYGMSYDWLVEREHCNLPGEVIDEIGKRFRIVDLTYFPLLVPSVHLNIFIGITAVPRP